MRRGQHPKDAGMEALRRIRSNTIEKRLQNSRGLPRFNVSFYILNKVGDFAGVALYAPTDRSTYAVCTESGARLEALEPLLEGSPRDPA